MIRNEKFLIVMLVGLPVTVVFLPELVLLARKVGSSLLEDLGRTSASDFPQLVVNALGGGSTLGNDGLSGARQALDTAGYFLWALFGVLGLAAFWAWALAPLRSRKLRALVAACLFLGIVAACPWVVGGIRQGHWIGYLLAVGSIVGVAIATRLMQAPIPTQRRKK